MRTLLALALAATVQPGLAFAQSAFSANQPTPQLEVPVRRANPVTRPVAPAVPVPPASQGPATGNNATFRANDSFRLTLSGMPTEDAAQYSQQPFTIGSDGFFNIPLAGQIRAEGLTQSQLERAIERKLVEAEIFRFPTATIFVDSQARFVTIGGAVRNPNRFSWTPDMTLLTAVSAAGGGGDFAGDKIELVRGGKKTVFSRKRLEKDPTQDPRLMPGDRIEHR
jgi:protein involved in polysaccharide export with SLBB domain